MMKYIRAVLVLTILTILSACGGGGGSPGNTSGAVLFTTAAEKITIAPGEVQTYSIGGGIPAYIATSSSSAATVSVNGKILTITGAGAGSATVTVNDAAGAKVIIQVTLGTGVDFFTNAPEKITVAVGSNSTTYAMGGGSRIYSVVSSNTAVVTVTQNGSQFFITGIAPGTATISMADSLGGLKKSEITVGSGIELYTTAPASVVVKIGASSAVYSIGGGSQVYSISSSDQSVATVGISNKNEFIISGRSGGKALITVKDTFGREVKIEAVVGSNDRLFSTAASDINVALNGSSSYKVGGGTTIYSAASSNTSVASVIMVGNDLTITGVGTGKAQVVVTDSSANSLTINVTVGTGVPTALFTTAGGDLVVAPGTAPNFGIGGGRAPYSVSSSNAAVLTASVSGSTLTINGVAVGTARVILSDSLGATVTINVNVGSGVVVPLFSTAPSAVTVATGITANYTVGGGTAPYSVTSSNAGAVQVTNSGSNFSIKGISIGSASVVVQDAVGVQITVNVTVSGGVTSPLYTTAPANITIGVGAPIPYTLGGGTAPYTVTSSNAGVASVTFGANSFTVTGMATGSGVLVIRDSLGATLNVNVTVGTGSGVPLFTTAPSSVTTTPGTVTTFTAGGGTAPYTVTSSDNAVLTVTPNSTFTSSFTITGVAAGSATVAVRDSVGALVSLSATVTGPSAVPLFTSAPSSVAIGVGGAGANYTIGGGTAPYTVTSSNTSVVSASLNASGFNATGNAVGVATISVRDAKGAVVIVSVSVGIATPLYTTAPSSLTLGTGAGASYVAGGGTGPYTVTSSDTSVVTATPSGTFASNFSITSVAPGIATVTVRDSLGVSVVVNVNVSGAAAIPLYTTAPANISIGTGGSGVTYSIGGGTGPYVVTSSNVLVASIVPGLTTFTVTGNLVGTATISIRDARGATVSINVNVGTAVPLFTTAPTSITIGTGVTATYVAGGGSGPYTITSSDTKVAIVPSGSFASSFTITGGTTGSATVVVRDSLGTPVSIAINVSPTAIVPIDILPGDSTGSVGDVLSYTISGGTAPYTVANNNPSIATVGPTTVAASGGTFTATLLNVGSTIVSITDAQGQVKKVTISANAASSSLRISPSTLEIGEDNSAAFSLQIKGGTGPYRVFTSDLVKSDVTISGALITVSVGSQGNRCIHPVDLSGVYQRGSTYTVTVTALDSVGSSATGTMVIRDNSKGAGATDSCGN